MKSLNGSKTRRDKQKKHKKKHKRPITETRHEFKVKRNKGLISRIHQLNKEKEKLTRDVTTTQKQKSARLETITREIIQLGGMDVYQQASRLGECRHGNYNSAKWVILQLKKQKIRQNQGKLELLDVGALNANYEHCRKWINATAIDLNPQKSSILQADFLKYQEGDCSTYDVIVLSLVINFAGDPVVRGHMLKKAQQLCRPLGHVFVVLPSACLSNSRYMTHDMLSDMMASLGFQVVAEHTSRKLAFKMYKKTEATVKPRAFPKKQLRNGAKMNNFSIVLR